MANIFSMDTGDGLPANSFGCEIEGTPLVVKEVTGLKKELDMIEVKSQTAAGIYQLRKLPGRQKPVTVTVTRALTDDMYFADWLKAVENGAVDRRDVIITVYSPQDAAPKKRYTVKHCQPSSLEVTQVQAGATNVIDEKVTLQGESVNIEAG